MKLLSLPLISFRVLSQSDANHSGRLEVIDVTEIQNLILSRSSRLFFQLVVNAKNGDTISLENYA